MSEIQAVLFKNTKWDSKKSRDWLKKNKYVPIKRVHKTDTFLRYRLKEPNQYKRFITKKLGKGIELIIGFK